MLKGILSCLSLAVSLASASVAATLVSETSSSTGIVGGTVSAQWTQTSTWNNVVVSAEFGSNNGAGSSVTAFLNQDGTALGNQVATAVVAAPSGVSTQVVFTGLTLTPGDYYFTVQPADGLTGFIGGGTATDSVGPGVTFGGIFTLAAAAYAPEGAATAATFPVRFNVDGDRAIPVVEAPTLSPSSLAVLVALLATAAFIVLRGAGRAGALPH